MSLYLQRTRIINVGPINNVELIFEGPGIYTISGKNDAGKTTTLLAIAYLLQPFPRGSENPLKNGEKSGDVIAWLGDTGNGLEVQDNSGPEVHKYKLSRHFTPNTVNSVVCEYVGDDFSGKVEAKKVLSQFIADMNSFDPWSFVQMKDKEQMDAVLKIVTIPLDRAKLFEIAGLDPEKSGWVFPEDNLACLDGLVTEFYEIRKKTNSFLEQAKATAARIIIPDEWKNTQPVKILDLMEEKKALEDKQEANDGEHVRLVQLKVDKDDILKKFNESMAGENHVIDGKQKIIESYRQQIIELENDQKLIRGIGEKERNTLKAEAEVINSNITNQQTAVDNIIPVNYTEIDLKISKADETNKWAGKVTNLKFQEMEVDKLSKQSIDFTIKMDNINRYKRELLEKTKFPCPGMSFKDGKVTMKDKNGVDMPLKVHGGATQLRAAFEVLRAQNPKLKVVLSFSETQIDEENTAVLDELVKKYGFQFLRCQVAEKAEDGKFYIENGVCG